jgi:hypothetical protein
LTVDAQPARSSNGPVRASPATCSDEGQAMNKLHGLWLIRHIGKTHAQPDL